MGSQTTLYELLEREFSPPVDSSLLTALLADINSDADGNLQLPSPDQIHDLRSLLKELALQAERDEHQLSEEFGGVRLSDETDSTPELYFGDTTTSSEFSGSSGSQLSFSSPLGFLQAALPHIPRAKLNSAIGNAVGDGEIDMELVVEGLLTDEYLRELEERGVDGLDSGDDSEKVTEDPEDSWETVKTKKPRGSSPAGKRKTNKGTTFAIVDIRQKQHARRNQRFRSRDIPAPDPWTQLSSLSAHVATLLPPHPPSFFQSFFHSPDHATPCDALRAALSSICVTTQADPDEHTSVLFGLLDILLSSPEALDAEERSQVTSDTQLALNATEGRGEDALDLVKLLQDLHSDSTSGYLQMGVYHGLPSSPTTEAKPFASISLPTTSKPKYKPSSLPPLDRKPSPFQWQSVPRRKTVTDHDPHPSVAFIPAYNTINRKKGTHSKGKVRGSGTGSNGDVGDSTLSEAQWCRRRVGESMRKRNELLREAARAWRRGNAKTRGGEAYYFAERAREVQEVARREALDVARCRVENQRMTSPDTVDLHGTTVAEAITIVKEILEETGASPHNPLTVITGRGTHSANKVSILRPAVMSVLVQDGWIVHKWDGGLTIRGKRDLTS